MPTELSFTEIMDYIIENPHEAIIFIDNRGIIKLINQGYADFLGYRQEELLGRDIREIVPQTELTEVLKTKKPQFGDIWEINGKKVVVSRLPVFNKSHRLAGVLGKSLFKDEISLVREFLEKVKSLQTELDYYREELDRQRGAKYTIDEIIGRDEQILNLKAKINKVAQTSSTILITGESGTGKELFAHAVHNLSHRRYRPFVKVNCTSIPGELLESELFGYEEGAFTGAKKGGKPGKFEIASGGTIFLDEIADMNLSMQSKLLRVLQEKEIDRLGGNRPIPVDVRIIAATNHDLENMTCSQEFRPDLYYRLNVISLHIPPLRNRKQDLPGLIDHIIQKLNRRLLANVQGLTADAYRLFYNYEWPGNVREMENILEQAINLTDHDYLSPDDFPVLLKKLQTGAVSLDRSPSLAAAMEATERDLIKQALLRAGNNKKEAARILGIHRSVLYRKMKKHNLPPA